MPQSQLYSNVCSYLPRWINLKTSYLFVSISNSQQKSNTLLPRVVKSTIIDKKQRYAD